MYERLVIELCAGSGEWSKPYEDAGFEVIRIDLPNDVRLVEYMERRPLVIIAGPPCTVFAASGAMWPRSQADMIEALSIADACLRFVTLLKPKYWAIENPVGKLKRWYGKPKLYFQPCDYGDPYTKKTCLWGEFNAPLKNPILPIDGSKTHRMSSSHKAKRAITPAGFAKAFYEANCA